jgi:hypothetical protein
VEKEAVVEPLSDIIPEVLGGKGSFGVEKFQFDGAESGLQNNPRGAGGFRGRRRGGREQA